jgi:hypothetical protein
MHIGVIGIAEKRFKSQYVGEKCHGSIDVFDDHEWRDLNEIRHDPAPGARLAQVAGRMPPLQIQWRSEYRVRRQQLRGAPVLVSWAHENRNNWVAAGRED